MKKILLATSILAATTGFAAAEVALTGDARMGVVYDGENVQFSQRARVQFNLSGQTDTGLEFGASFRADQASAAQTGGFAGNDAASNRRGTAWVSGAFGKLAMGDVNSAAEEAFGDLSAIGFTGLGDYSDIPYISGDGADGPLEQGPGALYTYATGAFEFHLGLFDGSYEYDTERGAPGGEVNADASYSVAVAYTADTFKVGIAYLDNGDGDSDPLSAADYYGGSQTMLYGSTEFSGVGIKAFYTDYDDVSSNYLLGTGGVMGDPDNNPDTPDVVVAFGEADKTYGLSLDYTFGGTTVTGFYRRDEINLVPGETGRDEFDSFGLGAAYDLGGGASINGGVVDADAYGDDGETIADLGIKLRF